MEMKNESIELGSGSDRFARRGWAAVSEERGGEGLRSFLNVNEGRYNPEMLPVISQEKWRKGSQWITLVRRHAEVVVNDEIIFPLFKKFCKRWPPADHDTRRKTTEKYHRNCIPDEHYVQTLLSKSSTMEFHRKLRTFL
uniref:Uncharacterized protein n=1 Tax=Cucumis melo TaxID=3656 RepID=A0A9I9E742_CUCME